MTLSREVRDTSSTLVYFHIPKTGGKSIYTMLERKFSADVSMKVNVDLNPELFDQIDSLSDPEKAKLKNIYDHMRFGVHEFLPQKCEYFTLLRDPVDRVISEYYYVLRQPDHPYYAKVQSEGMNLEDFARSTISPRQVSGQTRTICGIDGVDAWTGDGPISQETLDVAKKNLSEHFILVGLTERFDESLMLLKHQLGWSVQDLAYKRRNVTVDRPQKEDVPEETLALIASYNTLDVELYAWARQRFDSQISEIQPVVDADLQEFHNPSSPDHHTGQSLGLARTGLKLAKKPARILKSMLLRK